MKSFSKKLLFVFSLISWFSLLLLSTQISVCQPATCWLNLTVSPDIALPSSPAGYYFNGSLQHAYDLGYNFEDYYYEYMEKHSYVGIEKPDTMDPGGDHLHIYLGPDTNVTIYAPQIRTITTRGFNECYDEKMAIQVAITKWPASLNKEYQLTDTLNYFTIFFGNKTNPKMEECWRTLGKIIIHYSIVKNRVTVEFDNVRIRQKNTAGDIPLEIPLQKQ